MNNLGLLLNNLAKATKSLIANDLLDTEILFKANSFLKKDFIEILDKINYYLQNEILLKNMSQNSYQISNYFTYNNGLEKFNNIINDILN